MATFRTEVCGDFRMGDLLILKSYCLKLNRADTAHRKYKACYATKYLHLTNLQMDSTRQILIRVSLLHCTYK